MKRHRYLFSIHPVSHSFGRRYVFVTIPRLQCVRKANSKYKSIMQHHLVHRVSCLYSRLCCLGGVHPHPRLFDKAQQLLHVGTPVVHDILGAAFVTEVYHTRWSIDTRPYCAGDNEATECVLRLLRAQIKECCETRKGDTRIILCDDTDVLETYNELNR